jgi:hypothetical protein
MTSPVESDDLVSGAAGYLFSITEIIALLGEFDDQPMIFQRDIPTNMELSDATCLVVTDAGPWGTGNDYNTIEPRRLGIQLWTGPIRNSQGAIDENNEAYRRNYQIYKVVDKYLHRVSGKDQWWGSIRSVSSRRFGGYDSYLIPDGNGIVVGTQIYGVEIG